MGRYVLAVLVNNQFGVLNRVTSLFRRRQFNIKTLTVSETESNDFSRITVLFEGDEVNKDQLVNQLYKLPDVCAILELKNEDSFSVELMLIKVENNPKTREDILAAAKAFGAFTVDYSKEAIMFQLSADARRIDDFVEIMRDYGILEICRTGIVSLERGGATIREKIN